MYIKGIKGLKIQINRLDKKNKILISFYIFLATALIVSLSYVNTTFECNSFYTSEQCEDPKHDPEERPFVQFGQIKLNEIETESEFNVDRKMLFNVMANVANYNTVLPGNVYSVEIVEEESNMIIAKEVLAERGIKTTVIAKHTLIPYNEHTIEILDGDAKGTKIIQTFTGDEELTKISTKVELKLKGILKPFYYLPKSNFEHAISTVNSSFAEYAKILQSPDVMEIDELYRSILFRSIDNESIEYYIPLLQNGTITKNEIRDILLGSAERKAVEVTHLTYEERILKVSENNRKLIDDIYRELLLRPVDNSGLAYWGLLLQNELFTEEEIRKQIYESSEAQSARFYSDPDTWIQENFGKIVIDVYNEFGKEPSPEMLEYYIQLLLDREIHAPDIREKLLSEIGNE